MTHRDPNRPSGESLDQKTAPSDPQPLYQPVLEAKKKKTKKAESSKEDGTKDSQKASSKETKKAPVKAKTKSAPLGDSKTKTASSTQASDAPQETTGSNLEKVKEKVVSAKKPPSSSKVGGANSRNQSMEAVKSTPPPLKIEPKIIEVPQPEFQSRLSDAPLFSKDELEAFRALLVSEKTKILEKAKRAMEEGNIQIDKNEMIDEVDQAAAMIDQNLTFRLLDRDRKLLYEIEHALAKIDTGDYGYCEGTGEPIPKRRLELRPWCRHSVKYKEKLERMKKSGRGVVDEDEV